MKNAAQLKAVFRKMALENNVSAQSVMQTFMFERLLERISISKYREKLVLKGGMLIAAMIGVDKRSTMDLDTTLRNFPMNEKKILNAFSEIIEIYIDDGVNISLKNIEPIRKGTPYGGFRVSLEARYGQLLTWLKIDISADDAITPDVIEYHFKSIFEEREIVLLAYPLETVLAEKYESILSLGVDNTRSRDFYDIYMLLGTQQKNIDNNILVKAIYATVQKRNSQLVLSQHIQILEKIKNSSSIRNLWSRYQKEYVYAFDISFEDTIKAIEKIGKLISILDKA